MKKRSMGGLVVLVVMLGAAALSHAQVGDALKVNVPFNFVAGGVKFPAGSYTVDRASESRPDLLRLRGEDGEVAAFLVNTTLRGPDGNTELVFNRYADRYFLSEIHTLAGIHQLPRPRMAKLAKAAGGETVSLPVGN
jgi:hypothetical protein